MQLIPHARRVRLIVTPPSNLDESKISQIPIFFFRNGDGDTV
jgi:hypothetical protein